MLLTWFIFDFVIIVLYFTEDVSLDFVGDFTLERDEIGTFS